jgi:signal transduction histidine kinase
LVRLGEVPALERDDAGPGPVDWCAALLLMALAEVQLRMGGHWDSWGTARAAAAVVLTALQTAPVAGRRRAPLAVLLVTGCAAFAQLLLRAQSADLATIGVLVAFFTVVARSGRTTGLVLAALAATGIAVAKALDQPTVFMRGDDLISVSAQFATAWLLGTAVRRRRERVAAERTRIAAELHDVVSHSLSVMLVQAGAARAHLESSPDVARACLQSIDAVGRRAWTDMRGLLDVVRHETAPGSERPGPSGLGDLDAVMEPLVAAGLTVELMIAGQPRPVPAEVDRCAAQVVKEGLTNALAHAGPVRAGVTVEYRDDALAVAVTNECGPAGPPGLAGGHGLRGLRERVRLLGGELSAAPRAGGYAVRAVLPLDRTPR